MLSESAYGSFANQILPGLICSQICFTNPSKRIVQLSRTLIRYLYVGDKFSFRAVTGRCYLSNLMSNQIFFTTKNRVPLGSFRSLGNEMNHLENNFLNLL